VLISMTSIPLWAAIAVLACLWGLLVWRMLVMLPGQYLPQTLIGLTACSVVFIIRDRASHFGLESAALQEAALDLAALVSTLGQPHIYRRMLALSELKNKDRDTRRAARRVYWRYAARLAACVAVLLTALAVGVKGALLPGRVPSALSFPFNLNAVDFRCPAGGARRRRPGLPQPASWPVAAVGDDRGCMTGTGTSSA
jgi:hypothetical protein